jgi:UDP-2,3-diacylglucosamine hydrolase
VNKNYFFISDIHLGLFQSEIEAERENKLVEFLNFTKSNATHLFILGDLFDYWFEYKRVIQKDFFRTINSLYELSASGVEVHYIIGNHDFLHRDFFKEKVKVNVHHDPIDIILEDKRFFLGHGDGLVRNDKGYKILKKILRNKFLQRIYSSIHPDLGIKIASGTSKKSRDYTSKKHYGYEDGLFETAVNKFEEGFDYVVFGHSHVRSIREHEKGIYINLGTWLDQPCYGKYDGLNFEIIEWN